MTDGLQQLIKFLIMAAEDASVSLENVRCIRFSSDDAQVESFSVESWRRLKNFLGDADIRSRDQEYDAEFRQEMRWRSERLMELLSETTPNMTDAVAKDAPTSDHE